MKKLSLFLLVSVFAFCGCSDDDEKMEVVISFENQLTEAESEFKTDLGEPQIRNYAPNMIQKRK